MDPIIQSGQGQGMLQTQHNGAIFRSKPYNLGGGQPVREDMHKGSGTAEMKMSIYLLEIRVIRPAIVIFQDVLRNSYGKSPPKQAGQVQFFDPTCRNGMTPQVPISRACQEPANGSSGLAKQKTAGQLLNSLDTRCAQQWEQSKQGPGHQASFYVFLPILVILKMLRKLRQEKATLICIAPT